MFYIQQPNSIATLSNLNEIPFDYFNTNKFFLMTRNDPFFDSILSLLPKLLKFRIPECKVYIIQDENNVELTMSIFKNNPWVDSIIDNNQGYDFYMLNTNIIKNKYLKLTYENALINQMLEFWKFPIKFNKIDLLPEIYFDDDTINYITELNASWKTDNDYIVISITNSNNIVQISNMIASCNINNIIVMPKSINIFEFNNKYNVLNLNEFILPDYTILGLIKLAKMNIGSSAYFDLMRIQNNIYSTHNNELKHINYIQQ